MRVLLIAVALLAGACDGPEAPRTTPVASKAGMADTGDACALQRIRYDFRGLQDEFLVGDAGSGPVARQALFAKQRIRVNTDGAPRSYHSVDINADDPKIGALNIICNAGVKVRRTSWLSWLRDGEPVACRKNNLQVNPDYAKAFEAIRANDWRPVGG